MLTSGVNLNPLVLNQLIRGQSGMQTQDALIHRHIHRDPLGLRLRGGHSTHPGGPVSPPEAKVQIQGGHSRPGPTGHHRIGIDVVRHTAVRCAGEDPKRTSPVEVALK